MNLIEAKRLFFNSRKLGRIEVCEDHVVGDHPERAYSVDEVVNLINSVGRLQDTTDPEYKGHRFYWRTKDLLGNSVRLVVEFDSDEHGMLIVVVSAGERR